MTAGEWWALAAVIVACAGVAAHLVVDPPVVVRTAPALVAAALALLAVALLVAL